MKEFPSNSNQNHRNRNFPRTTNKSRNDKKTLQIGSANSSRRPQYNEVPSPPLNQYQLALLARSDRHGCEARLASFFSLALGEALLLLFQLEGSKAYFTSELSPPMEVQKLFAFAENGCEILHRSGGEERHKI